MFDFNHFKKNISVCYSCPHRTLLETKGEADDVHSVSESYCLFHKDMCVTIAEFGACDEIK